MLTNTHYATSLPPPLPHKLNKPTQPKTTDKRFFLFCLFFITVNVNYAASEIRKEKGTRETMTPR